MKRLLTFFSIICLSTLLFSCGNDQKSTKDSSALDSTPSSEELTTTRDAMEKLSEIPEDAEFEWIFDTEDGDVPKSEIWLSVEGRRVKIATEKGICNELGYGERADLALDDEALAACKAWWGDTGALYAIEMDGENLVVVKANVSDMDAEPTFEVIKTITVDDLNS